MFKSAKILAVDDDPDNLAIIEEGLTQHGYVVYTAENVDDGLRLYRLIQPDIILLDIMMPDVDGYEFCRCVRSEYQDRSVKIIFVSAKDITDFAADCYFRGANAYLGKPFSQIELHNKVELFL